MSQKALSGNQQGSGIGGGGGVSIFFPAKLLRASQEKEPLRSLIELRTLGLISDALSTSEERSRLLVDDKLRDAAALMTRVDAT